MERWECWLDSFHSKPENAIFVRVSRPFIGEFIGSIEKSNIVPHLQDVAVFFTSPVYKTNEYSASLETIEAEATIVYKLAHARFIETDEGLAQVAEMYKNHVYPPCPRDGCHSAECLPFGLTTNIKKHTMLYLCPLCLDLYRLPGTQSIDGAFFGPLWAHRFMEKYPELLPQGAPEVFVPQIYGYELSLPQDRI